MDKDLEYYLAQARRIAEHRETGAEKGIRKSYKELLANLRHFVSDEYAELSEDDKLTYAILQQKGEYTRFLEETEKIINASTPEASKQVKKLVNDVYKLCYNGMVEAVNKSSDLADLKKELKGVRAVTPAVVKEAVENPIAGLTLSDTLEKRRKEVVYEIKQAISVGLVNGDRYSTMAKRITERVDMGYRKAVTIARTEAHRVREAGFHDSATEINDALSNGVTAKRMYKTWKSMQDERVRKTNKANHRKMDGVSIPVDEEFDLGHGVKAKAPAQSGDAANDINCRCFLKYELKDVEEKDKHEEYSIGGMKKPVRPKKSDYGDQEEYYKARDKYKQEKKKYESELESVVSRSMNRSFKFDSKEKVEEWANSRGLKIEKNALDGIDARAFDDISDVVDDLTKKYPFLKKDKLSFGGEEITTTFQIGKDKDGAIMSAGNGLNLGESFFKNYEEATRTMLENIADGYNVRGDGTVKTCYRHELGHNVQNHLYHSVFEDGTKKGKTFFDRQREFEKDLRGLLSCDGISEYAKTNEFELFAEAFAEYTSGGKTELAVEFGKLLERALNGAY